MESRDFKGIWITKEVWLDKELNALDKVILMEIDSLDNEEKGCYASNKYLAEFCQCSESKVSATISKLIKLGYLYIKSFDGRQRELKSRLSNFRRQTTRIWKADSQILEQNNIDNNINNNRRRCIDDGLAEIVKVYEENIGLVRPIEYQYLQEHLEDFSKELVIEAIKIAALNGARRMNYINAVLKDWKDNNIKTIGEVKARQENFSKNKNNGKDEFLDFLNEQIKTFEKEEKENELKGNN